LIFEFLVEILESCSFDESEFILWWEIYSYLAYSVQIHNYQGSNMSLVVTILLIYLYWRNMIYWSLNRIAQRIDIFLWQVKEVSNHLSFSYSWKEFVFFILYRFSIFKILCPKLNHFLFNYFISYFQWYFWTSKKNFFENYINLRQ
jgi:hypothetical protein